YQNFPKVKTLTSQVSPGASRSYSPAPSGNGHGTEDEEDPVSLTLILKELRGVGKEVKEFRKDTKSQLLEIRGELDKVNARLNEVETRVSGHEDELQNTDKIMVEILKMQERLQAKLTSLEAYSRRESLRLYGVPEGAETGAPSMAHFVKKLLRENLGISSTALQIQRAHRALSPPPLDGSQPRSILVKFLCFTIKEEVLRLAWQKKGFLLNSNKISLDHDYPPEIMAMRREYAEPRKVLKEKNLRFRTLYPARLKVFFEEQGGRRGSRKEGQKSLGVREKSRGERTQPCGEPVLTVRRSETFFPSLTCCFLSVRKSVIHLQMGSGTFIWDILSWRRSGRIVLNAELKSTNNILA
uniref:L1 transposable element RRM domain-containing protein n=1 Tax=Nothobranchius furzeri TaxID=105023 RepID=A0A8C6KC52_NOTFU